jgi:hypothetical protein
MAEIMFGLGMTLGPVLVLGSSGSAPNGCSMAGSNS